MSYVNKFNKHFEKSANDKYDNEIKRILNKHTPLEEYVSKKDGLRSTRLYGERQIISMLLDALRNCNNVRKS